MELLCKCIKTGFVEELVLLSAEKHQTKKLAVAINGMPEPVNIPIADFSLKRSLATL